MSSDTPIRVKVCGITNEQDAKAAADAGADAVGLNFFAGPRRITVDAAELILQALPPLCTPVALIEVGPAGLPDELLEFVGRWWISHLQVYGEAAPEMFAQLLDDGFKPVWVCPVRAEAFPDDANRFLESCGETRPAAVLLDAHHPDLAGGTGVTLDWQAIRLAQDAGKLADWPPLILAGGLTPENIADAITTVRPFAVDVSSGVERSPGLKDAARMTEFVRRARSVQSG